MMGRRPSTSFLVLTACFAFWGSSMTQHVLAQDRGPQDRVSTGTIHFALPAQPLAQALEAFSRVSDLMVVADASLLDARTSAPLVGDYAPQVALARLLTGTGLLARVTGANSAIVLAEPSGGQVVAPAPRGPIDASMIDGLGGSVSYANLVQARLTEALCQSGVTRPGRYRLALQLRIGSDGAVAASMLLDTTGDATLDAAITHILSGLVFDYGPPADLPQPVTILLRPQTDGVASGCDRAQAQG